ncbi:AAA family ATPase [Agromyces sp. H66]|uniref:AAA family ATPase n=1 Tax=Agromyces sp. H66 TaxID=2529859 RepID=UPI0010AA2FF2|nr:AAA family ATPase [Agromyces sp. H66]
MRPELNPYSPGSGLNPPHLVGRQAEIDAFDLVVARTRAGHHNRGMILHGLRGVGKTVLLNQFREQAERAEWFIIELEGRPTETGQEAVRQRLARLMMLAGRRFLRGKHATGKVKQALGTIKSFSLSLGVASVELGLDANPGRADSGQIEIDFEELVEDLAPALREASSAFALFIDEMQDLDSELVVALLAAQHRAGQKNWPFYIFGAGLPSLPSVLSEARSYAERLFNYRNIGALERPAAADALTVPATRQGARYEDEAINVIVDAARGYPYFLQTYGQSAWGIAEGRVITADDAREAIIEGNAELDMGFFPARWDRATPAERNYLRAMARDGEDGSRTSELAERLKVKPASLSPARQNLISKGIIFMPERGRVAFTVPNMAAFIQRQFAD